MSGAAPGRVEFFWGDGQNKFFLGIAQLEELQEKTGVGPERLFTRLGEGDWKIADITETIRLGLLGADMTPANAYAKVKNYCYPARPLSENIRPAMLILAAALRGPEHDKVGKTPAETPTAAPETPTDA